MTAGGVFSDSGSVSGNTDGTSISFGDLDGDGDLDLVIANLLSPNVVWLNDGAGRFSDSGLRFGLAAGFGSVIADFDGDGDLDIAFRPLRFGQQGLAQRWRRVVCEQWSEPGVLGDHTT